MWSCCEAAGAAAVLRGERGPGDAHACGNPVWISHHQLHTVELEALEDRKVSEINQVFTQKSGFGATYVEASYSLLAIFCFGKIHKGASSVGEQPHLVNRSRPGHTSTSVSAQTGWLHPS